MGESNGQSIRKITPEGVVTTLISSKPDLEDILGWDGVTTNAPAADIDLGQIRGLAYDETNNLLIIATEPSVLYTINLNLETTDDNYVNLLAGGDAGGDGFGTGANSQGYVDANGINAAFAFHTQGGIGIGVDSMGNVYVGDPGNSRIRKVTPTGEVTTIAGDGNSSSTDGTGTSASFSSISSIHLYDDNTLYVYELLGKLRKVDLANNNEVTTVFGQGVTSFTAGSFDVANVPATTGMTWYDNKIYVADWGVTHSIYEVAFTGPLNVDGGIGDNFTANLAVTNGTLSATASGSANLTGDGTATFSIQGTKEDVNATLLTLEYTSDQDYNGADTLTYSVTDGTSTSAEATITITVDNDNADPGEKAWEYDTGEIAYAPPAIGADGTIYAPSENGILYALDGDTGAKLWEFDAGSQMDAAPTVGPDGTVYVGTWDTHSKLFAINGATGAKVWETSDATDGIFTSPALSEDGTLYVTTWAAKVYAFDSSDGSKLWEYAVGDSGDAYIDSSPAVGSDGTIYFGSANTKVYAINPDGTEKWTFTTGGEPYGSPAIGADGTVYVGSVDAKVYALDSSNGSKLWEFETGEQILSSPVIGADGTIYIGSDDDKLYALDPSDGSKVWEFATGGDIWSVPAVGSDGTVYIGSNDSKVYAVDGSDGSQVWEFTTGGFVQSFPALGTNNMLYIGSNDNKVYAIHTSSGPADSPWPMFGRNVARIAAADPIVGPTISGLSTASGDEDSAIDLAAAGPLVVAKNEVDNLTVSLAVDNGTLSVTLNGSATISAGANDSAALSINGTETDVNATLASLSYQGTLNYNGSDTLTYSITDGVDTSDDATATFTVNSVNDDPVLAAIGNKSMDEDTPLEIDLSSGATDVDTGDTLTYWSSGSGHLQASFDGDTLTLTPATDWYGTESVTIMVDDGNGGSASETIDVTVNALQDEPTVGGLVALTTDEDVALAILGDESVSTFAGTGAAGSTNGTALSAQFSGPIGIVTDSVGNFFVTDHQNNVIRKIDEDGNVTTFAGDGTLATTDGTGAAAQFNSPWGLAIDAFDNLYVTEYEGYTVRKITPGGVVTTLAGSGGVTGNTGGTGADSRFGKLPGLAIDINANVLYVGDQENFAIWKVDLNLPTTDANYVTLFAGGAQGTADGTGAAAQFDYPSDLAVDSSGNIYVADIDSFLVRKVTPAGVVTTISDVPIPGAVALLDDNALYVTDLDPPLMHKIELNNMDNFVDVFGDDASYTHDDGALDVATISEAYGMVAYDGDLYFTVYDSFTEPGVHKVRKLDLADQLKVSDPDSDTLTVVLTVTEGNLNVTLGGSASITAGANDSATVTIEGSEADINATLASLQYTGDLNYHGDDTLTYTVSDGSTTTDDASIALTITSINDAGPELDAIGDQTVGIGIPKDITLSATDVDGDSLTFSAVSNNDANITVSVDGTTLTISPVDGFSGQEDITVTVSDGELEDSETITVSVDAPPMLYNQEIMVGLEDTTFDLFISEGVTSIAGQPGTTGTTDGTGTAALLNQPGAIAINSKLEIFVADIDNHLIRKISRDGEVTTFAGSGTASSVDGTGTDATFNYPIGLAIDSDDNLYVSEHHGHVIRKITPEAVVTTIAGSAGTSGNVDGDSTTARFTNPRGMLHRYGVLYIADFGNHAIRKINLGLQSTDANYVQTLAGSGTAGHTDDTGAAAQFDNPAGLAFDGSTRLFVADVNNHAIRQVTTSGVVTTVAGTGSEGFLDSDLLGSQFANPYDVTYYDSNILLVADRVNNRVRKVDLTNDEVTTLYGGTASTVDGSIDIAQSVEPWFITSLDHRVYVSDNNHVVREVIPADLPSVAEPEGQEVTLTFSVFFGTLSASGDATVTNSGTGSITISGSVEDVNSTLQSLQYTGADNYYGEDALWFTLTDGISTVSTSDDEYEDIQITVTNTHDAPSMAGVDSASGDEDTAFAFGGATLETLAEIPDVNLDNMDELVFYPALPADAAGNRYLADPGNYLIRKFTPEWESSVFAGSGTAGLVDDTGEAAQFRTLTGIAIDGAGNLYVNDTSYTDGTSIIEDDFTNVHSVIRKITPAGVVTTIAGGLEYGHTDGSGSDARFGLLMSIAYDAANNLLYVADLGDTGGSTDGELPIASLLRKIDLNLDSSDAGFVTTLAGNLDVFTIEGLGDIDGQGTEATLLIPVSMHVDSEGSIYVADFLFFAAFTRKVSPAGLVDTLPPEGDQIATFSVVPGPDGKLYGLSPEGYIYEGTSGETISWSLLAGNGTSVISDGPALTSGLGQVADIALAEDGLIFAAVDPGAEQASIRKLTIVDGLRVNDPDGNEESPNVTANLSVTSGTLTAVLSGDATISAGENGTSTLSINGSLNDVNATLASILYQGSANYNGSDTLTFSATDGTESTSEETIAITVNPVNDAPVLTAIGNQSDAEDTPIEVTLSASDIEGDDLTVSANNSTYITSSVTDNVLTLTPTANFHGTEFITITVDDGNEGTATETIQVTFTPVNDDPVLEAVGNKTTAEDTPLEITLAATDVDDEVFQTPSSFKSDAEDSEDETPHATKSLKVTKNGGGETLTFSAESGDETKLTVAVVENTLTVTPAQDWNGTEDVTITVEDGNGGSDTETIQVTVSPVNDAPVLTEIENQSDAEDTPIMVTLAATDVDMDDLTFSATVSTYITSSVSDNVLTLTPTDDFHGTEFISVTVKDGDDASDSKTVMITFTPVNDDPVLEAVGNKTTPEDTPFDITLTATDVDNNVFQTPSSVSEPEGSKEEESTHSTKSYKTPKNGDSGDTLTYSAESADETKLTVSVSENVVTVTPADNWYGTEDVIMTVEDGNGGSDTETIAVTVTSVNDLPVLTAIGAQSIDEDTPKILTLSATDVEDEDSTLTFTAESSAPEVTPTVQGDQLTLTPDANWYGTSNISVTVTDADNGEDAETFVFTVNSVNDEPTIESPGDQMFTEFDEHPVTLVFGDVESPEPTIEIEVTDDNLEYDLEGSVLTLTASDWYGEAMVTITITDADQASDEVTFNVTVNPFNVHPPVHIVPEEQLIDTSVPFVFSIATENAIQVDDLDSTHITTTIEAQYGILKLFQTTGLEFKDDTADKSAKITIFGSLGDINTALDGMSYCSTTGYVGGDTIVLQSVDNGELVDDDEINLTVEVVAVPGQPGVKVATLIQPGKNLVEASITGFDNSKFKTAELIGEGDDLELAVLPIGKQDGSTEHTTVDVLIAYDDDTFETVTVPVVIYHAKLAVTEEVSGVAQLNRSTGLYEQVVEVENTTPYTMEAIRIHVEGLNSNVTLQSITDTGDDGVPYIQYDVPLTSGEKQSFLIEFKSRSRRWDANTNIVLELLPEAGEEPILGELREVDMEVQIGTDNSFYLNFLTEEGTTYYIQYAEEVIGPWKTSNINVQGSGQRQVWVDDGPPKTTTHPSEATSRFYRIIVPVENEDQP